MRDAGISGLVERKRGRTTIRVPGVRVAVDLVQRQFRPAAPNVLWPADRAASSSRWPSARRPATQASPSRWAPKAYDNAVAESFFASLKKELVHRRTWPTRRELTGEIFEYIEAFYNNSRRHSTLGYLSPAMFEQVALPTNNKNN
jgi:transposase InsO family protein